jgi:hypothetical protein
MVSRKEHIKWGKRKECLASLLLESNGKRCKCFFQGSSNYLFRLYNSICQWDRLDEELYLLEPVCTDPKPSKTRTSALIEDDLGGKGMSSESEIDLGEDKVHMERIDWAALEKDIDDEFGSDLDSEVDTRSHTVQLSDSDDDHGESQ